MSEAGSRPPTVAEVRDAAVEAHRAGRLDEASELYAAYLAASPDDGGMWSNLGALHRVAGRHDLALIAQKRAYALMPRARSITGNLANILADTGETERALELRRQLLADRPDDPEVIAMMGKALRTLRRYDEAISLLKEAAERYPDHAEMRVQLALTLLAAGRYLEGFEAYEARWLTGELAPRRMAMPRWDGSPLDGRTILVVPEQGFGDALAFSRFLPVLKERCGAGRVLLLNNGPVHRLLSQPDGVDAAATSMDGAGFDTWCYMMDALPHHFAASPEVPPPTRLHVPDDSRERAVALAAPARDRFRVGLVWNGSVTYRANAFRSFSHREYWPLLDLPDTQFYGLHKGPMAEEMRKDGTATLLHDVARTERDFADTAAMMRELDLVVTTCTATAHLAGSLGVPAWVLLHWDSFWMWGADGETTPWYPSVRLIRQETPRDWAGVIARVRSGLEQELDRWRKARAHG
ncbi:tetratricopeptide repeat protein [Wenxinia marina]|uniref:TPR repeat protein/Tetratricopeptide repeat protein n=1 Tax=Wenxinia marina DSM 24838 TaxID=1123501 RepID=A0A0D0QFT2_9RHOB|nr:tetratricopeptide repeat-containing glycosyltransferase family protein [Wenxinia marina]KIQ71127.1 TPR repeat protein/Tetratricopeptide repeat protein [Wenxinia marina DSM 24838]GGL54633.1 hypothetical protein GCM10011392_06310 [Wenxinia marina]